MQTFKLVNIIRIFDTVSLVSLFPHRTINILKCMNKQSHKSIKFYKWFENSHTTTAKWKIQNVRFHSIVVQNILCGNKIATPHRIYTISWKEFIYWYTLKYKWKTYCHVPVCALKFGQDFLTLSFFFYEHLVLKIFKIHILKNSINTFFFNKNSQPL